MFRYFLWASYTPVVTSGLYLHLSKSPQPVLSPSISKTPDIHHSPSIPLPDPVHPGLSQREAQCTLDKLATLNWPCECQHCEWLFIYTAWWWTVDTDCTEVATEYGWVQTSCHSHPIYSVKAQFPNRCEKSIRLKMRKGSQRFTVKHLRLSIDSEIAHKVATVHAQWKARLWLLTAAAIKSTRRAWHWTPHSARYIDLLWAAGR